MKKRLLSGLLCGTLTMSLLGGTAIPVLADDDQTITMWTVFTGSDGDILREIVKDYNESNEDGIKVDIDIMDGSTLQAKLPTAISTNTAPDFVLMGIEYIYQYANNDMIIPLDDFWEKTGLDESNYLENVVDKSKVDGTLYGVPMQYNLQYLYYNKDLFEEAGLDPEQPPTTMEELAEDAKKLTNPDKNQYGIGFPTDYASYCEYLWSNGGDVVSEDGKENNLNSEANIKTLEWIQDLVLNENVSPQGLKAADADTMFQSGQLAIYTSGPWNINGLKQLGVNFGITAIPSGSDGAYAPEGGCAYMIPKSVDDSKKDAIYKWMAYWLSDDVLKEWSTRNGFPVWSNSLLEDEDIKSDEILTDVSDASKIGRNWHLNLDWGSQIDQNVMQPMMEQILSGTDVSEALQTASDTLDGIIAEK